MDPTASLPDCYASSPALARDDATGELWLAWVQWDCPQLGVFVQQVDRSNGQLVGSPQVAPGTAGNLIDVSIGEPLAFTGRPGQGGVYLAYPAADGGVSLWRVGEPGATKIPSQDGDVGQLDLRADPAGGRLWVAWSEDERLWLGRSDGGELIGAPRSLDPPPGVTAPLFTGFHWDVSASPNGLDVLYGYPRSGETPGGIWHTLVTEG